MGVREEGGREKKKKKNRGKKKRRERERGQKVSSLRESLVGESFN